MIEQNAEEFISELTLLDNASKPLAIVIVEGETDKSLYQALIKEAHSNSITVMAIGNRSLVISCIEAINNHGASSTGLPPILGLIDQDYLVPLGVKIPQLNIILTDLRDVECMMMASEALKELCNEYMDWEKSKRAGVSTVADVRAALTRICAPLGKLRYWSQSIEKHYIFKRLDVSECLNSSGNDLDRIAVLNKLRGAQVSDNPLPNDAFKRAEDHAALSTHFSSDFLLCRGHDLAEVFSAQIRKKWGQSHAREVKAGEVERNIRMAFPRFWGNYLQIQLLQQWFSKNGLGHVLT